MAIPERFHIISTSLQLTTIFFNRDINLIIISTLTYNNHLRINFIQCKGIQFFYIEKMLGFGWKRTKYKFCKTQVAQGAY